MFNKTLNEISEIYYFKDKIKKTRHNKGTTRKKEKKEAPPPPKKIPRRHLDIKPGLPWHMSSTLMNELRGLSLHYFDDPKSRECIDRFINRFQTVIHSSVFIKN